MGSSLGGGIDATGNIWGDGFVGIHTPFVPQSFEPPMQSRVITVHSCPAEHFTVIHA